MPFPSRSTIWQLTRHYAYLVGFAGYGLAILGPLAAVVAMSWGWSTLDPDLVQYAGMLLCIPLLVIIFSDASLSEWRRLNAKNEDFRRRWDALEDERNRPIGRVVRERLRPRKLPRRSGMNRRIG